MVFQLFLDTSGKIDLFNGKPSFISPEYELIKTRNQEPETRDLVHTGRLVPIYPETEGVSSKWLRSRINTALKILKQDNTASPQQESWEFFPPFVLEMALVW